MSFALKTAASLNEPQVSKLEVVGISQASYRFFLKLKTNNANIDSDYISPILMTMKSCFLNHDEKKRDL